METRHDVYLFCHFTRSLVSKSIISMQFSSLNVFDVEACEAGDPTGSSKFTTAELEPPLICICGVPFRLSCCSVFSTAGLNSVRSSDASSTWVLAIKSKKAADRRLSSLREILLCGPALDLCRSVLWPPLLLGSSCLGVSRDIDRTGDRSVSPSRSFVYWLRPFVFLCVLLALFLCVLALFGGAFPGGGVSGAGCVGAGGSTLGWTSVGLLLAARVAAKGISSEGSESTSG